jgi:hypothetical protein
LGKASVWIRIAAVSGFVMTVLDIYFSAVPIIQVSSSLIFTLKIAGVGLAGNLLGLGLYVVRTAGPATQLSDPAALSS